MEFSTLNGYKVKDKKAIRYYDTVADMKADTTLKSGMHVRTKGYYSANDGGSSLYEIIGIQPINNFYEELNNELYAQLIPDEYVNSRQIGLKGDETDETTLLQLLLNTYPKVILKSGNYLITSSLTITTTKEILGEIGAVINASDSSDGLTQILVVNNNSNVIIKNIKINGTMTGTGTFTGLRTNNSTKCYYENIEITGTSMGFYTTQSEDVTFNNCYIHDTKKDGCTITDSSSNVTIENCTAKNTGDDSFAVVSYNTDTKATSNVKMINNTAIDCKKRSYLVDGGENIIISNNYALNGKNNLIAIIGNSSTWNTKPTKNIIVDSNVCELTNADNLDDDIFVSLFGIQGASYVTFTNNRFDASSVVSTITRHNDNLMYQTDNVIIKNNYIDGAGVRFRQTTNLELVGNVIKHAWTHAIYVLSVNNMRIENNECYDYNVRNTTTFIYGIYCWTETVNNETVRPNTLRIINNYLKTTNNHTNVDTLLAYVDNAYIEQDPQSPINVDNSTNVSFGSLLITDLADATLNNILTNGTIYSDANGTLKVKTSTGIKTISIT